MQQIAVNQMNGTSGGSLRQKLDLSDACQATDAFAMLFMQLMGQTIQPEALLQMQGEQPLAQTDAVLPAAAGTVGSMASGNEMQAMLADLIQNAGSTPAEGAFLQTFAMQSMDTVPGTAAAEGTVQGAELLEGEAEGMQQLYTVLKAAWGGEESSSLMENGFSSLQAGNAFRTARQLLEQQEKETVVPVDVESLQAASSQPSRKPRSFRSPRQRRSASSSKPASCTRQPRARANSLSGWSPRGSVRSS